MLACPSTSATRKISPVLRYRFVPKVLRSLCGVMRLLSNNIEVYVVIIFSTAWTLIRLRCLDKKRASSCPGNGVISLRSLTYFINSSATSWPKYTMSSCSPFRIICIFCLVKSTSCKSKPTHSETRMPVPNKRAHRAAQNNHSNHNNVAYKFGK